MVSQLAARLVGLCAEKKLHIATAESCTGGLVSAAITDVPGASDVFTCGFVTYANEAKTTLLGVTPELMAAHGSVSKEVAGAMAYGALAHPKTDISVAITGIAGPTGGTPDKPVGTVFIATAARNGKTRCEKHLFPGDRTAVRAAAAEKALEMLLALASEG